MVEGLVPALIGAMEAASAGTAAKGTMDMMNSGKGKPRVLGDGIIDMGTEAPGTMSEEIGKIKSVLDKLKMMPLEPAAKAFVKIATEMPEKKAKSKDTFKTPKEIQDVIDNDLYLSISNHPDKDGLLTTLGMAGLGSPELKRIGKTGAITADTLKKLPPELMKDLATGLGIAMAPQGSRTTSIPVPEEDLGSDYQLVSGKDIAKQVRGSESYSNMMADFDPNDGDDDEEKKDKKDKKQKLDRKVDDASEKFAKAMNKKIVTIHHKKFTKNRHYPLFKEIQM